MYFNAFFNDFVHVEHGGIPDSGCRNVFFYLILQRVLFIIIFFFFDGFFRYDAVVAQSCLRNR